jgi:hypothetical protein
LVKIKNLIKILKMLDKEEEIYDFEIQLGTIVFTIKDIECSKGREIVKRQD